MQGTDWQTWHDEYDDPESDLSRRLAVVRRALSDWLDATPGPVRVLSLCSGDGRDLLGVLAGRDDAARVSAVLVELDEGNAERARQAAGALEARVDVRTADAGDPATWADAVPVDLVLLAGIFGNVRDADVEHTVRMLPRMCRPGATVVWTRHRGEPDLTPTIRAWFRDAGLAEVTFVGPDDATFGVGVHRLSRVPDPGRLPAGRLFTFTR